jgi:hypothetical protein
MPQIEGLSRIDRQHRRVNGIQNETEADAYLLSARMPMRVLIRNRQSLDSHPQCLGRLGHHTPTMNVRTCSPTGPESCARDRMNAANDSVSLRRNRSSARAKSTSVSIVTGTPQETDLLARVASVDIIEMGDVGSRGELNFLASIPDFEPELPAFEAHHHPSKLFPGNLPSVDHEHG